jgi:hypothetical protein
LFPTVNGLSGVIPPNRMHTTREQSSMSQMKQINAHVCIEDQLHVKDQELVSEGGLESNVEKTNFDG